MPTQLQLDPLKWAVRERAFVVHAGSGFRFSSPKLDRILNHLRPG